MLFRSKLLLSILRKAQNLSTLVALRFTTALRRHVLALNRSGVAKSLVWVWFWIISRDKKSNLPEERSDTSHPSQPYCQADNPPDYIACASAPNHESEPIPNTLPPSNTASSDTVAAPSHLNGAGGSLSNEGTVPSSIQEQSGSPNAGAGETKKNLEVDVPKDLVPTTPSSRKRYDRGISMCVINFYLSL